MTLRSEIHAAIDEIAPPAPDLRREMLAATAMLVTARPASSRARFGSLRHFRVAALIAAALIAVLVVGGVLIGGRVLRDYQRQQSIAAFERTIDLLRERPLALPLVTPGAQCPETATSSGFDLGYGPVYVNDGIPTGFTPFMGQAVHSPWGSYYDTTWVTKPGLSGPVLVRGRDLNHGTTIVFVGPYATGPVVGTDYVQGKQTLYADLVLNADHPPALTSSDMPVRFGNVPGVGYGEWIVRFGTQRSFTGCLGFQIDGPSFSETIVAHWAPSGAGP